jgi:hypothetical protein
MFLDLSLTRAKSMAAPIIVGIGGSSPAKIPSAVFVENRYLQI